MEQTPYRPRPVTAIAPSVTHADVRLAPRPGLFHSPPPLQAEVGHSPLGLAGSGVRCGACQPGHTAVGQAYLNKAANLFGMAHDRQLLEGCAPHLSNFTICHRTFRCTGFRGKRMRGPKPVGVSTSQLNSQPTNHSNGSAA